MNQEDPALSLFRHKTHYVLFMTTIIIIAAIGFFASDIYLPSLPAIGNYFQKGKLQVQLTMSVFLLTMAFCQVFAGALSDKLGRKKILFISIVIFILGSVGCYQSHSLNELILFRFFQGVGAASGLSIGQAIVADLFGPTLSAKPLSIIIPLVAFSPAVAPILGGIIEEHSNWRNVFLFLVGYGILIFILILLPIIPKVPEKHHESNALGHLPDHSYFKILTDKNFIGYALCMMNSNACYFAFLAASPFLLQAYGYSPSQVGYAFCAASFPYMAGSFFGRRFSLRMSYLQIIFLGLVSDMVGVAIMLSFVALNTHTMLSIMIPVFAIAFGNGFIMPFSSASAIALFPKKSGFVTGSLASLQLCAASLGTFMMGLLSNGTMAPLAFFNLTVVSLTTLYFLSVFGRKLRHR